jgi:hypothetical protein
LTPLHEPERHETRLSLQAFVFFGVESCRVSRRPWFEETFYQETRLADFLARSFKG